jgi:Rha family phage regulatory protein
MPATSTAIALLPPATVVPVITPVSGVPMTNSRNVAAMFGKRHDNVLRGIRGLLNFEGAPSDLFVESAWTDPANGQTHPQYLMTRDGFALLAMGFTGTRATRWKLDFVAAFNRMEAELRRQRDADSDLDNDKVLKRLLLGRIERIEVLEAKVEQQNQALAVAAPKVEAYDSFLDNRGHTNLRTVARVLGIAPGTFFEWAKGRKYIHVEDGEMQPRSDLTDHCMRVIFHDRNGRPRPQTVVTRAGVVFFQQRWAAHLLREQKMAIAALAAVQQPRLAGI